MSENIHLVDYLPGVPDQPTNHNLIFLSLSSPGPMDYTGINTTLTFHPGTTRLPLFVAIKDDTVDEMAEIFFLSLVLQTPMEAVTLDPSTAMVSIVDNDGKNNLALLTDIHVSVQCYQGCYYSDKVLILSTAM